MRFPSANWSLLRRRKTEKVAKNPFLCYDTSHMYRSSERKVVILENYEVKYEPGHDTYL